MSFELKGHSLRVLLKSFKILSLQKIAKKIFIDFLYFTRLED
jgi:hypothetical protein